MKIWEYIKKEKKLLLISIAIIIIGISAIVFIAPKFFPKVTIDIPDGEDEEIEKAQVESFSPEFTLNNINGEEVKLDDYRGKVLLLTFWTSWHPIATEQLSILEDFYQKNKDDDQLALLTINNIEAQSTVKNYVNRAELSLPVLLDEDGKVGELYKITAIPLHIFINQKGRIKEIYIGTLSEEEINEKLNRLR